MKTKSSTQAPVSTLNPAIRQQLLAALAGASQLTHVDAVQIRAERRYNDRLNGELAMPESVRADQQLEVRFAKESNVAGTSVLVSVVVQWKAEQEEQPFAIVGATFRLAYLFKNLTEAPHPEVVSQLANELGVHHAWPFLRERIRTLSGEIGMPPYILPLRPRPNA